MKDWKLIPPFNIEKLNYTGTVLHQLAQLLSMFSHSYLHHEDDDSHNNLGWDQNTKSIVSHSNIIPRAYMSFNLKRFCISIGTDTTHEYIPIENTTFSQCIDKCRIFLNHTGLDGASYKSIKHFEITSHPFSESDEVRRPDKDDLAIWGNIWTNTFNLLSDIQKVFPEASEIRIWPHHFDVGLFIPIETDKNKSLTKSLGLGLAIADTMIDEPYYYLSYWSIDNSIIKIPEKLPGDGFMPLPESWQGYALPISTLAKYKEVDSQPKRATNFFEEGINVIFDQLNMNRISF